MHFAQWGLLFAAPLSWRMFFVLIIYYLLFLMVYSTDAFGGYVGFYEL